jgi:hypothetical protein
MAITGRQARRELPQVQALESEVVHLAYFESADTQYQSRGDSPAEELQTINFSFRAPGEDKDYI